MDLQDALKQLSLPEGCVTQHWLNSLDDKTRGDILKALETLPVYRVWRAAKVLGEPPAATTFSRHFAGSCKCRP